MLADGERSFGSIRGGGARLVNHSYAHQTSRSFLLGCNLHRPALRRGLPFPRESIPPSLLNFVCFALNPWRKMGRYLCLRLTTASARDGQLQTQLLHGPPKQNQTQIPHGGTKPNKTHILFGQNCSYQETPPSHFLFIEFIDLTVRIEISLEVRIKA